jgi:hypothetical protein
MCSKGRYYNVMVKTSVILGESEFLLEQALPRIKRKVFGNFYCILGFGWVARVKNGVMDYIRNSCGL